MTKLPEEGSSGSSGSPRAESRDESVQAEHGRLKRQIQELRREHKRLHDNPTTTSAEREEHRNKLHAKLIELEHHLVRLRGRAP